MSRIKRLRELYARLPEIKCRGYCHRTCGVIPLYRIEADAIKAKHGSYPRSIGNSMDCSMLDSNKRCSIHPDRPMICRLYGIASGMACTWGCIPEGGWIPDKEAHKLLGELAKLDGGDCFIGGITDADEDSKA